MGARSTPLSPAAQSALQYSAGRASIAAKDAQMARMTVSPFKEGWLELAAE